MTKSQSEVASHVAFLVSHAKADAQKFTSKDGARQQIEAKITKAQTVLLDLIQNKIDITKD